MAQPALRLETIHRQAQDNPIIQLSIWARESGMIPVGKFGVGVRKLDRYDSSTGQEVEDILRRQDEELMVLTGYNWTRQKLNQEIRGYREIEGKTPKKGDRVIALRNNWEAGIYNGMTGTMEAIEPIEQENEIKWYEAEIIMDDEGLLYTGKISAPQFGSPKTLVEYEGLRGAALGDLFDFGYALTVHKAQGSQAPRVLLFEERNKHMSDEDWRRWLYTGVTRAEEELTIVGT
jgi:exodeoxyribonuclease V